MKRYCTILAALCLLTVASCGKKAATQKDDSLSATETVTEAVDEMTAVQETTEGTELPALTSEIPADAVIKETTTATYNGEVEFITIYYLNEHGDALLTIDVDPETGKEDVDSNHTYKYDEDGNMTYHHKVTKYDLTETFFTYDENGDNVKIEEYENDKNTFVMDMMYDKNHHLYHSNTEFYGTGSKDPENPDIVDDDLSSCEFDDKGNILVKHFDSGSYSCFRFTYDQDNHMLTKEYVYSEQKKESDGISSELHRYEYDPNCGKVTLDESTEISVDGTEEIFCTETRQYDEKGRQIRYQSVHGSTTDIMEAQYEYLKQAD